MLPRFAQSIILILLLIVFPITSIYPHTTIDRAIQTLKLAEFTDDLNYDQLLSLFEAIESGKVDQCSPLEQAKIAHFITYLAQKGMLSTDDNSALEEDIEELLEGQENGYRDAIFQKCGGKITCVTGKAFSPSYQSNWFSKRCRYIKNFVKKHKKALIIGAVVVVATAAVVTTIVVVTSKAAARAAAAAAEEKIIEVKEQAAAEGLFEETEESLPSEENARALGSLFAHEVLNQLPNEIPLSLPEWGHFEIDQSFGVNYAHLANFDETNFTTLSYQMRGEHALFCGYFNQAVHDFGKVIEHNPTYALAYLERGMAHFELGNYQTSLEDYHQFSQHKEKFSIPEFSIGFAKGVPKGIYDSGEGALLFLSEMVSHPVDTSTQMWHSLNQLKGMVSAREWALLGEVLVPEIYQLVTDWDGLTSIQRGELAGYALGKHGADILLPGAAVKVASSGMKCSKELFAILKNLQNAEQILVLESVATLGSGTAVAETVQNARSILTLGEEVGLTTQELGQLKQVGALENAVAQKAKYVFEDPALKASYDFYKEAQNALKPYNKTYLPESRVRELIHQTGVRTFERPKGIPETYLVRITDKGAGMEYVHPLDKSTSIRIMPGKPHSPFPYQQNPYVIVTKNNKNYDKFGNIVNHSDPAAHIPIEEFIYVK